MARCVFPVPGTAHQVPRCAAGSSKSSARRVYAHQGLRLIDVTSKSEVSPRRGRHRQHGRVCIWWLDRAHAPASVGLGLPQVLQQSTMTCCSSCWRFTAALVHQIWTTRRPHAVHTQLLQLNGKLAHGSGTAPSHDVTAQAVIAGAVSQRLMPPACRPSWCQDSSAAPVARVLAGEDVQHHVARR